MELTIMRKKINAMRRRYQRTKRDDNLREARKQQYQQEKTKYTATIRKSKMLSWKKYCSETTAANPWNAAYKLATGNKKTCGTFSTLRKPDGTITKDFAETARYMIESFAPTDSEESDNDRHKLLRMEIKEPITTEDDTPFTTLEIREAIKGIEKTRSPGEDGITSDFLLRAFNLLPKFTTALYNGCLRTACFPRRWKTTIIIPIIKPGKETCDDIFKYLPISLINTTAKVIEKILTNGIMLFLHSHNLLNHNQYGFTSQTSSIDAVIDLKEFVQQSIKEGFT
jgi:hypothetical protein